MQIAYQTEINGQCYDVGSVLLDELPGGTRSRVITANDNGIAVGFIQTSGYFANVVPKGWSAVAPIGFDVVTTVIDGKAFAPIYLPKKKTAVERGAIVVYAKWGNGPCAPGYNSGATEDEATSAFWAGTGDFVGGLIGLKPQAGGSVKFPTWAKWTLGIGGGLLGALLILKLRR